MNNPIQSAAAAERMEHLFQVISSERFRLREGLGNEVPFFVCPYKPAESVEIERCVAQLVNRLSQAGVNILAINLYDLCIELLKQEDDWDWFIGEESKYSPDEKKVQLQNILDVETVVVPSITKRMSASDFDVLFITGTGEVFPYIRTHNLLNNLQRVAKEQPTVIFFPGEYNHSLEKGASLDLFGRPQLQDDKYYRAFNIFDRQV